MPLDLVLLARDGTPEATASIPSRTHPRLIEAARAAGAPLIVRLHDEYADVGYLVDELPALDRELATLEAVDPVVVRALRVLVRRAIAERRGVFAIAD